MVVPREIIWWPDVIALQKCGVVDSGQQPEYVCNDLQEIVHALNSQRRRAESIYKKFF
jgi:thiamine biosynthesis lipoprotein ApbE